MSNYIEYNDKIAFHPGYYISEAIEESGLTQYDLQKDLILPQKTSAALCGENKICLQILP